MPQRSHQPLSSNQTDELSNVWCRHAHHARWEQADFNKWSPGTVRRAGSFDGHHLILSPRLNQQPAEVGSLHEDKAFGSGQIITWHKSGWNNGKWIWSNNLQIPTVLCFFIYIRTTGHSFKISPPLTCTKPTKLSPSVNMAPVQYGQIGSELICFMDWM